MSPLQVKILSHSFWLAPALMLVSDLITLFQIESAFWVASISFWFTFYLFIYVIIAMVQMAGNTTFATISGLLAIFGSLIGITIIGSARFAWGMELTGVTEEVLNEVHMHPWIFFTSRFPGILFPIGLILLSFGLKRKGIINNGILIGLLISIILFPMGRIPKIIEFNVVGDILMIVFFGMLVRKYQGLHQARAASSV
ncbi:MAG: hypothetical protein KDC24_12995 [Saprospiraceae bacterium]|nr:hypothetical protein [Saprospiraceae bacterium]